MSLTNQLSRVLGVAVALAMSSACLSATIKDTIVISTSANDPATLPMAVVIRAEYDRLGIDATIKKYPLVRSLKSSNAGTVDAELARIDGLSSKYPNLIQVKPAFTFVELVAFSKQAELSVDGWESLRPYRMVIARGHKLPEQGTQGMDVSVTANFLSVFKMLQKDRVDIALSPLVTGWFQRHKLGAKDITQLRPPIAKTPIYHYLHTKRKDLVEPMSAVLTQVDASGELVAIRANAVQILLDRIDRDLDLCDQDYSCYEQ